MVFQGLVNLLNSIFNVKVEDKPFKEYIDIPSRSVFWIDNRTSHTTICPRSLQCMNKLYIPLPLSKLPVAVNFFYLT